jgi:hypothetical protein
MLVHAIQLSLTGSAWRALLPTSPSQSRIAFLRLRWIREAINNLLPVAQIGGEVVGARLLARQGVPLGLAGASATVDLTVEVITQILFTLVGIGLLLKRLHGDWIWEWLGLGLPAALLAAGVHRGAALRPYEADRAGCCGSRRFHRLVWAGSRLRRSARSREPTRCCVAPCATACVVSGNRRVWSHSPRSATRSVFATLRHRV